MVEKKPSHHGNPISHRTYAFACLSASANAASMRAQSSGSFVCTVRRVHLKRPIVGFCRDLVRACFEDAQFSALYPLRRHGLEQSYLSVFHYSSNNHDITPIKNKPTLHYTVGLAAAAIPP